MNIPSPDRMSDNQPVLTSHPRINSRSEPDTSYCVRAPFLCIFYVINLYCYYCGVFTVSSPLFLPIDVRPLPMLPPLIDYVVVDRVPLPSSFQASSAPSPLPYISSLSVLFYCTSHMLLLRYNPIQLHSLSLSPLVIPFRYPMLP